MLKKSRIGCGVMRTKSILAIAGLSAGVGAVLHIATANALTLKGFDLDVGGQLIAQRLLTVVVFCALGAAAASADWLRSRVADTKQGSSLLAGCAKGLAIAVLPLIVLLCTINSPFWSYTPPSGWDRPRFLYGWPIPWKTEAGMTLYAIVPALNWLLWTAYAMFVMGFRKWKSYRKMLMVAGVLILICALLFGVLPLRRGMRYTASNKNAWPGESLVCLFVR